MLHKISLIDELKKGGYEASLITTFNAYLPFYEEVVLRKLVHAGVKHNVLMMDARQYASEMAHQPPKLAGRYYTLMPMQVPGAFHPKLLFLAGRNKGLVAVGSHNMTLAGFGFNRELTNLVRVRNADDESGVSIAQAAWAEVEYWIDAFSDNVPQHVIDMVLRIKESAPWLSHTVAGHPTAKLLGGAPGKPALWEQLSGLISREVEEISICGAFFDRKLRFLDRVKEDLTPKKMAVAIDPKTVAITPEAKDKTGYAIVQAADLGQMGGEEEKTHRYLHAKGILIKQGDGAAVFASGSANPSAPAWLADHNTGNVELMLAQTGQMAIDASQNLGFDAVIDGPPLETHDWDLIGSNHAKEDDGEGAHIITGIASVDHDSISLSSAMVANIASPTFELRDIDGERIAQSSESRTQGSTTVVRYPEEELAIGASLAVLDANQLKAKFLLHHAHAIENQSRRGVQRKFKDALSSLQSDSPDINLLIKCLDDIVFSDASSGGGGHMHKSGRRGDKDDADEIDLREVKERLDQTGPKKTKHRLRHSSDLSYLLDVLIYNLRIQRDTPLEPIDGMGRSEEEQIGSDDEEIVEAMTQERQAELLNLCHAKVRTIVNRSIAQIKAYKKGEQTFHNLLIRLLAVLAVLRELRACDGRVSWVDKGENTVPVEQRRALLASVVESLFEGEGSLFQSDAIDDELSTSDDMARLKGLMIWLAWDSQLTLNWSKPFNESRQEEEERVRNNAIMLTLAQLIGDDDIVMDEARESIGKLTVSEMEWLKDIENISHACQRFINDQSTWNEGKTAKPGDMAMHKGQETSQIHMIARNNTGNVYMVPLSKTKNGPMRLRAASVTVSPFPGRE